MQGVRAAADVTQAFRDRGLKVTPQRQVLFEILCDHAGHPCADTVFAEASKRMPGISLRTVYHTLTDLVAMGELGVLSVDSGATRFDPNVEPHHHTVCRSCGAVGDVYLAEFDRPPSLDGFVVDSVGVIIRGLCATCAAREGAVEPVEPAGELAVSNQPNQPNRR